MRLLIVLFFLPVIYVGVMIAYPFLFALYSFVTVAEKLRSEFGPLAAYALYGIFTVLTVYSRKSSLYFWFGLLPATVLICFIARTLNQY